MAVYILAEKIIFDDRGNLFFIIILCAQNGGPETGKRFLAQHPGRSMRDMYKKPALHIECAYFTTQYLGRKTVDVSD